MEAERNEKARCPRKLKKKLKSWTAWDYVNGVCIDVTAYDRQKRQIKGGFKLINK